MNNSLFITIIFAIIFWVAVWDSVEIAVEDFLKYISKDSDNNKLIVYLILAFLSFGVLYYTNNISKIV